MESQPTVVPPPLQVRIADDLRMRIERRELRPGDSLPTLQELGQQWGCSLNPVRAAITLLKQQGLITGGRGKAPVVRVPPRQVVRSSERHQEEKDLVLAPEEVRGKIGTAETEMKVDVAQLEVRSDYTVVPADEEAARPLGVKPGTPVLRRIWEHVDPATGRREARSVSHIPKSLVESNPALFDPNNEPWPGGTQHQLYTVGIEIIRIVDEVTATMPTTAVAQRWELESGVPMLLCRRISIDAHDRVVEISDAEYPADRTMLSFTTPLKPWKADKREEG
ncbi:MAG: GntR family transcriptional regulator [Pseudonocardiaceae bacterium]